MKAATKEKIMAQIETWEYMKTLPKQIHGFDYVLLMQEKGDVLDLYRYENKETHRSVTVYYHEETNEYKLRMRIGLTEFCVIEYIYADLAAFQKILQERCDDLLADMQTFNPKHITSIVHDKKIMQWDYKKMLPETFAGFKLFITPDQPVRVINGSYIIFDYSDFTNKSNFIIYYNVFRDEFFGESRVFDIPEVSYDFDSHELQELVNKLEVKLFPHLQKIRTRVNAGK
ncbi:hypothetical protein [Pectinatus cerevisiiphilus]|uniref:Uncharacterized protein n=1 Tax=Pectinatus cerevisiiphilus TaxID=86956 RepID=A0A4V6NYX0_9FIRM|nr:hypothetical protein [Pectinatus cerevisiiphilus]TCS80052.1 hypothetical protein EDC37_105122 [Pectinatus cerevisiiphilus]